jgi:hypothetical protein
MEKSVNRYKMNMKKKLALVLALVMMLSIVPGVSLSRLEVEGAISNANLIGPVHQIPLGRNIIVANAATRDFWVNRSYIFRYNNPGHNDAHMLNRLIDGTAFHHHLHLRSVDFGTAGEVSFAAARLHLGGSGSGRHVAYGGWLPDISVMTASPTSLEAEVSAMMMEMFDEYGPVVPRFQAFAPLVSEGGYRNHAHYSPIRRYAAGDRILYFGSTGVVGNRICVALIRYGNYGYRAYLVVRVDKSGLLPGMQLTTSHAMPINYHTYRSNNDVRNINLYINQRLHNFDGGGTINLATRMLGLDSDATIPTRQFDRSIDVVRHFDRTFPFLNMGLPATRAQIYIEERNAGAFDARFRDHQGNPVAGSVGLWEIELNIQTPGFIFTNDSIALGWRHGGNHGIASAPIASGVDLVTQNRTMRFFMSVADPSALHNVNRLADALAISGLTIGAEGATATTPASGAVNIQARMRWVPVQGGTGTAQPWANVGGPLTVGQFAVPRVPAVNVGAVPTLTAGRADWGSQNQFVELPGVYNEHPRNRNISAAITISEASRDVLTLENGFFFMLDPGVHVLGVSISSNYGVVGGNNVVWWAGTTLTDNETNNPYGVVIAGNSVQIRPRRAPGTVAASMTVRFYLSVQPDFVARHGNTVSVTVSGLAFIQTADPAFRQTYVIGNIVNPVTVTAPPTSLPVPATGFFLHQLGAIQIAEPAGTLGFEGEHLTFRLSMIGSMHGGAQVHGIPLLTLNLNRDGIVASGGFEFSNLEPIGPAAAPEGWYVTVIRRSTAPGVITINNATVSGVPWSMVGLTYSIVVSGAAVAGNMVVPGHTATGIGFFPQATLSHVNAPLFTFVDGAGPGVTPPPTQPPWTPTPPVAPPRAPQPLMTGATYTMTNNDRVADFFRQETRDGNIVNFISARVVADFADLTFDATGTGVTISDGLTTVAFFPNMEYVLVNDEVWMPLTTSGNIQIAPIGAGADMFLPAGFFNVNPIASVAFNVEFTWTQMPSMGFATMQQRWRS